MSRHRDYSGVPQTCPLIDDALNQIAWLRMQIEPKSKDHLEEINTTTNDISERLETVRTHNDSLRNYGMSEYERAEELEKEKDELERQLEREKADVEHWKKECDKLQDQIDNLENATL